MRKKQHGGNTTGVVPVVVLQLDSGMDGHDYKLIHYNRDKGCYCFYPVYDNEECWIKFVVHYGFKKYVYEFCVYNKDYQKDFCEVTAEDYGISTLSDEDFSENVVIGEYDENYPSSHYGFPLTITNNESSAIKTYAFLLEKQVGGVWRGIEPHSILLSEEEAEKERFAGNTINPGETKEYSLSTTLHLLFKLNPEKNPCGGVYRVILPYEADGEKKYAASDEFTIGYVAEK